MSKFKILTILGARPQFIKAASVSSALKNEGITEIIVNTGQHYDYNLSDVFFNDLDIPQPKYNLGIGSQSHGKQTGSILSQLEDILLKESPDGIIVYGDTNSTLGGALSASKLNIPIIHIEAGLRSFNRSMPEEINRVITDHVSSLLFCPSEYSEKLLKAEGIKKGVFVVGDVMYDIFLKNKHKIQPTPIDEEFALLTMHRAENTNSLNLSKRLKQISKLDINILFPIHPRTLKVIESENLIIPHKIQIINPLGYLELLNIASAAKFIITDSGGLQKEALWLKKHCLTIRDETEWVETIEQGANKLIKLNDSIHLTFGKANFSNPYGDGNAANIIAKIIKTKLSDAK